MTPAPALDLTTSLRGDFPLGTFSVHGALGTFGAHGRRRATPLATNCWPEAAGGGGELASWDLRSRPPWSVPPWSVHCTYG